MVYVLVTGFIQLALARVASAVGESGCMPPTCSLLGDYYPEAAERARAMSIYWLASPFASLISFMAGGWLNGILGWRMTFFVMGIPALIVAAVVKLTIAEPRSESRVERGCPHRLPPMTDVLGVLWRRSSSRHLSTAIILIYMLSLGMAPWYAAFLMRSHGMSTAELGIDLGFIFGLGGVAGILFGGYAAQRWFAGNERGQLRLSAATLLLYIPAAGLFLLLPQKAAYLTALSAVVVGLTVFLGPTFALMQRLVADDMRARAIALVMLLANLIGMGIGPLAVGMLSDWFAPRFGIDSLRYAMLAMSSIALWPAYHLLRAGGTVKGDLVVAADSQRQLLLQPG
jgi:predicted MFS family arabinose efflux permease